MQHRDDDRPMFESGDQDYESMTGWDPRDKTREKVMAEARKKHPELFQPPPQMFHVARAGDDLDVGTRLGPMRQLFGPFWLEEEVAVLYAPPGLGKSVLAVQIAEHLARGVTMEPFRHNLPPDRIPPDRVLYLDFEMTRPQFAQRYTAGVEGHVLANKYEFSEKFLRAEHFWNGEMIDGYEDFTDMLFTDIENRVSEHNATALIVDNVTFLTHSSTASSTVAFRLMSRLKELRRGHGLSILVLAHTPKHDEHVPLSANDLQGSIDLAKVADSMFVMGRSGREPDIRYLKQVKSRSGEMIYGEENVIVYRLTKFDLARRLGINPTAPRVDNFLGFDFIGYDDERHHLSERPPLMPRKSVVGRSGWRRKKSFIDYTRALARQGLSASQIAKRLGVGKSTAHRYMQAVEQNREVTNGRPS